MKPWHNNKPHRSLHFIPGTMDSAVSKINQLNADCIMLDLEDSVAPEKKIEARKNIIKWLDIVDFGNKKIIVRINSLNTNLGEDDLRAIASHPKVDAVLLPKVETPEELMLATKIAPSKPLWLLFETPKGIFDIRSILANVHNQNVEALCFGNNDLSEQMGTKANDSMIHARSEVVLAARARNLMVFDGPSRNLFKTSLADGDEITAEARNAFELGFDGKMTIHPFQLPVINRAFSPAAAEVRKAEKIKTAFEGADGKGAVCVDGEMVEVLHYRQAKDTIRIHEAIASNKCNAKVAPS